MAVPSWREVAIDKSHDRKGFDCGQAELNVFLAQYARQAHEGGSAKTYCAIDDADGKTILGFYTISPGQIEMHQIPVAASTGRCRSMTGRSHWSSRQRFAVDCFG